MKEEESQGRGSGHAPSLKASHNKEIRHDVKRLYLEMGGGVALFRRVGGRLTGFLEEGGA